MSKNVAIVAGAVGIVGKYVILELSAKSEEEWSIIALSRRPLNFHSRAKHLAVDLLSAEDVERHLKEQGYTNVTHIFFAAYQEKPTQKELVGPNLTMLKNLVEAVEKVSRGLKHVSLIAGTKWYGPHLGPGKTPYKEDDPRYMTPNFYYDQQDYLSGRVKEGVKWSWSSLRPNPVCGLAFGNPMNLVTGIAVYASICKEVGLPFRFPGSEKCWTVLWEVVDAGLLAQGMVWAATEPKCSNEAFNFSNGDLIRWCNIWDKISEFFGLEVPPGPIMRIPLTELMSSHDDVWANMQKKYNLKDIPFKDLASWPFVEWVMTREYDWFSDVNKARRYGFEGMTLDSADMFLSLFQQMRNEKLIP
jgi:nucleoside-diphosphate-sugar epimerase